MNRGGGGAVLELGLQLDIGPGSDKHELDELTRLLRDELLEIDVQAVDLASAGAAPATAKGFGLAAVGGLVVKLAGADALRNVVDAVRAWLTRDAHRSAKLVIAGGNSIELTGLTAGQQQQLIETWIQQVTAGAAPRKRNG